MVEEPDIDGVCQPLDLPGHLDIGSTWFCRPRRMIVRKNDAMRAAVEGAGKKSPQRPLDLRDRPLRNRFVGQIAPVLGDESNVQTFGRGVADHQPEIFLKARIGRRYGRARYFFAQSRFDQRPRRDNRFREFAIAFERSR